MREGGRTLRGLAGFCIRLNWEPKPQVAAATGCGLGMSVPESQLRDDIPIKG